jgi:2-alkyl-3-oxoalkanoate reductase
MPQIAVIGAKGFIGGRTAKLFAERSDLTVVPVIRPGTQPSASIGPNVLPRAADALELDSLAAALQGCDAAVHCVAGNPWLILKSAEVALKAAQKAGVKRLVYLSTASVHGQAPAAGTHDDSPLSDRQFLAYNNAKVRAERLLMQLSEAAQTEVVRIRPGIVFGPGSMWTSGFANALLDGTAYWVNGGSGICNSVYIDNLVHGIYLGATAAGAGGQAFIIGDEETVTWRDFYLPLAQALDQPEAVIRDISLSHYQPSFKERLREGLKNNDGLSGLVFLLKQRTGSKSIAIAAHQPPLNYELAQLYQCRYQLPHAKAAAQLGYRAPVSFEQACRATAAALTAIS